MYIFICDVAVGRLYITNNTLDLFSILFNICIKFIISD